MDNITIVNVIIGIYVFLAMVYTMVSMHKINRVVLRHTDIRPKRDIRELANTIVAGSPEAIKIQIVSTLAAVDMRDIESWIGASAKLICSRDGMCAMEFRYVLLRLLLEVGNGNECEITDVGELIASSYGVDLVALSKDIKYKRKIDDPKLLLSVALILHASSLETTHLKISLEEN